MDKPYIPDGQPGGLLRRPIHDTNSSLCNLAKDLKLALDRKQIETKVPTATFELLLDTIISLTSPAKNAEANENARNTVAGMIMPPSLDTRGQNGGF